MADYSELKNLIQLFKQFDNEEWETAIKALLAVSFDLDENDEETYNILENAMNMYYEAEWIKNPWHEDLSDYINSRIGE